jgi:hypothetical protein
MHGSIAKKLRANCSGEVPIADREDTVATDRSKAERFASQHLMSDASQ